LRWNDGAFSGGSKTFGSLGKFRNQRTRRKCPWTRTSIRTATLSASKRKNYVLPCKPSPHSSPVLRSHRVVVPFYSTLLVFWTVNHKNERLTYSHGRMVPGFIKWVVMLSKPLHGEVIISRSEIIMELFSHAEKGGREKG